MKIFQIFLLLVVVTFSGCRKDMVIEEDQFIPIIGGELVSSKFIGQIINEAGLAVNDAVVRFGELESITNEDGVFSFTKMDLASIGQLVTVEKDGYFTSYKKIIPTSNQTFLRIGLVTKPQPTGSFMAPNGGIIAKLDGEKITFQPNSIKTATNENYQGTVTVYTHHFNPENPYFMETMPGDLSAIDKSGNIVQLATYSMILVELFGENGEPLNLKESHTATVEFPIKGTAANSAPDVIPLWSLDENTGTWIEEGQVTKEGDFYVGEVSHFSFWNCDVPFELVNLAGKLIDLDGNPISHQQVSIEIANGGAVRYANTNMEGLFAGAIPKDELLTLRINNICQEAIYTQSIGPFSTDQNIVVSADNIENLILLTGSIKDCEEEPVENGYAVVEISAGLKEIIPIDAVGNFSHPTTVCENEDLIIYGVDQESLKKSPEISIVNAGQMSENLGEIVACDVLNEFLFLKVDGSLIPFTDSTTLLRTPSKLTMQIIPSTNNPIQDGLNITITNPTIGANSNITIYIETDDGQFYNCSENPITNPCLGNFTIELTQNDNFPGGFVEGVASGNLWSGNQLVPIEIEFKLMIDHVAPNYTARIWNDLNQNGILDVGEPGIIGATIGYRYDLPDGTIWIAIDETNANGLYTIPLPEPSNGKLSIIFPSGYVSTFRDQGFDEARDSDFQRGLTRISDHSIQNLDNPAMLDLGIHLE